MPLEEKVAQLTSVWTRSDRGVDRAVLVLGDRGQNRLGGGEPAGGPLRHTTSAAGSE